MPLTKRALLARALLGSALLACCATILAACVTYDQYEGGGRRTDLGDGGYSVSGSVTADSGASSAGSGGGGGADAGDAGCVTGDAGLSLIQCL